MYYNFCLMNECYVSRSLFDSLKIVQKIVKQLWTQTLHTAVT